MSISGANQLRYFIFLILDFCLSLPIYLLWTNVVFLKKCSRNHIPLCAATNDLCVQTNQVPFKSYLQGQLKLGCPPVSSFSSLESFIPISRSKMFFTLLAIVAALLFLWRNWAYSYWKRHNVPCPEPTFPVGNLGSILSMKRHICMVLQDWYK